MTVIQFHKVDSNIFGSIAKSLETIAQSTKPVDQPKELKASITKALHYVTLANAYYDIADRLTHILDSGADSFTKAQELRKVVETLSQSAKQYEELMESLK